VATRNEQLQRERLLESIERECGETFMAALRDDDVFEIALNPDGRLWTEKAGRGWRFTGEYMDANLAVSMLKTCASMLQTQITYDHPILEGEFPLDGSRLQALIPPVVTAPVFALRKKAVKVFMLDEYVENGIIRPLTPEYREKVIRRAKASMKNQHPVDVIRDAIATQKNILVVGGTGSGKTTLANAILAEFPAICPHDRVITIEDTRELQIQVDNIVSLRTSDSVSMQRLLRATMRLKPNRIIVGEVRGGEALALLKSWNTGHPGGVATLHADSTYEGLIRLEQLIEENAGIRANPHVIATAVKLVVFIEAINEPPGRLVTQISEVLGHENGRYVLKSIV
jgi:Flp pilus assembly CpaF family ATPase